MSLIAECLGRRPSLFWHKRPCVPEASTCSPHLHLCGSHNGVPRRSPTAIRTVSSSISSPRDGMGKALSHAPDSGRVAARTRARSRGVKADSSRLDEALSSIGDSQDDCRLNTGRSALLVMVFQISSPSSIVKSSEAGPGKIWDTSSELLVFEAR